MTTWWKKWSGIIRWSSYLSFLSMPKRDFVHFVDHPLLDSSKSVLFLCYNSRKGGCLSWNVRRLEEMVLFWATKREGKLWIWERGVGREGFRF